MVRAKVLFGLNMAIDAKLSGSYLYLETPCVAAGQVWSWGDGDYGKLGRGGSDGCKTPKIVEKLQDLDIVKVCCGSQFSLALTKDGQVYTWGKGDNQRLGHGTDEHVRYPKVLDSLQGERTLRTFFSEALTYKD